MNRLLSILAVTFFAVLTACSSSKQNSANPQAPTATSYKTSDGTEIHEITLDNGLKVLTLSNPKIQNSTVYFTAGVGGAEDPENAQGLAHFVEHMLFLGNDAFPEADDFKAYTTRRGATHNASTGVHYTSYYMQLKTSYFNEATSFMSNIFATPHFDETYIEKEKSAIQNEYIMRFDQNFIYQASQFFNNPQSPSRSFVVGNKETLKNVTGADARAFFEKHYSADNMSVVLVSPLTTGALQQMARAHFTKIKKRATQKQEYNYKRNTEHDDHMIHVRHPRVNNMMILNIDLKNFKIKDNIQGMLGHILGNESEGSLLAQLQAQGLAQNKPEALMGGASNTSLIFTIQLTPEGVRQYKDVVALTKGYLDYLSSAPFPSFLIPQINSSVKMYNLEQDYSRMSISQIKRLSEYFNQNPSWVEYFSAYDLPLAEALDYYGVFANLNTATLRLILSENTDSLQLAGVDPQKFNFSDAKKLDVYERGTKKYYIDGHYNTINEVSPLSYSSISPQKGSYTLPEANPYYPQNFEMLTNVEPSVQSGNNIDIHVNPGAGLTTPKAFFSALLFSPQYNKTDKKQLAQLILLKNWLNNEIEQTSYPLIEASYTHNTVVDVGSGAIQIDFDGWSDHFAEALSDYIKMHEFSQNSLAFEIFKQQQINSFSQAQFSPNNIFMEAMSSQYMPFDVTTHDLITYTQETDLKSLKKLYDSFFSKLFVQAVLSGNVDEDTAQQIIRAFNDKWPQTEKIDASAVENFKKVTLAKPPSNTQVVVRLDDSNTAYVQHFYQFGTNTGKDYVISRLIGDLIEGEFYSALRTEEQVAYSLSAGSETQVGGYSGISFYVESSTHSSAQVAQKMRQFLIDWIQNELDKITQEDIDLYVNYYANLTTPDVLPHRLARFEELFDAYSPPEVPKDLNITQQELRDYVKKYFIESPQGVFVRVKSNRDPTLKDIMSSLINWDLRK